MDNKDSVKTNYYRISEFDVFGQENSFFVELYTQDETGYVTQRTNTYENTTIEELKKRIQKAENKGNIFKEITQEQASQFESIIFKQYERERLLHAVDEEVASFVKDIKSSDVKPADKPTLIMLCGQAGAGKSNMSKEYEKRFEGNFVTIDIDYFKLKHPDFSDIVKMDGDSSIGLITRVENCINNLDKKLLEEENNLQVMQNKVRNSEALLQQPFEYEEQIDSLRNELSEIDNELNLDNNVIEVVEDKAVEQIDSEIAELEQAEIINSGIVANNQAAVAKATQRALK